MNVWLYGGRQRSRIDVGTMIGWRRKYPHPLDVPVSRLLRAVDAGSRARGDYWSLKSVSKRIRCSNGERGSHWYCHDLEVLLKRSHFALD